MSLSSRQSVNADWSALKALGITPLVWTGDQAVLKGERKTAIRALVDGVPYDPRRLQRHD